MSDENKKKKCFIITPIDDEGSPVRRHIDGIIDAVIKPVLESEYDILVSHRMYTPGSITKQVILSIYESDLVVANLTGLNPNVMYELAFRHTIRKPVITIMEKGDKKLPFDVTTERTIFYINDSKGVLELRENLEKQVETIKNIKLDELDNPIFSALESSIDEKTVIGKIKESKTINTDALEYIIDKLNSLEDKIGSRTENSRVAFNNFKIVIEHDYFSTLTNDQIWVIVDSLLTAFDNNLLVRKTKYKSFEQNKIEIELACGISNSFTSYDITQIISKVLNSLEIDTSELKVNITRRAQQ